MHELSLWKHESGLDKRIKNYLNLEHDADDTRDFISFLGHAFQCLD